MLTVPHGALLDPAAAVAPPPAAALGDAPPALGVALHAPKMSPNTATAAASRRSPCRSSVMSPPLEPVAPLRPATTGSAQRAGAQSAGAPPRQPGLMLPP